MEGQGAARTHGGAWKGGELHACVGVHRSERKCISMCTEMHLLHSCSEKRRSRI